MKDLKELLKNKIYSNSNEQRLLDILNPRYKSLKREHIHLHNGILSFKNIPSPLRMEIMLKKREILEQINKSGIYLRDIL